MRARRDMMVETVEAWLPKLSDQLHYVQKTYPVIVHRVPTDFVSLVSEDGGDLMALIAEHNTDIITRPDALKRAEFLAPGRNQAPHGVSPPIVLHFADPAATNKSIDQHIALCSRLLPTAKFIPPWSSIERHQSMYYIM